MKNIGIIILAAGESKRLGRPKQLLKFQGKTLLEKITETALETGFQVVIVLGANAEKIHPKVENLGVEIVQNKNWKTGMGSSIFCGLTKLLEANKELSSVVILLCDQPFISKDIILELIKKQQVTNKSIIACEYKNTLGVPALFTDKVFDELLNLNEKKGAKLIIEKYAKTDLAKISAPEAGFDIDTEEDLKKLWKMNW